MCGVFCFGLTLGFTTRLTHGSFLHKTVNTKHCRNANNRQSEKVCVPFCLDALFHMCSNRVMPSWGWLSSQPCRVGAFSEVKMSPGSVAKNQVQVFGEGWGCLSASELSRSGAPSLPSRVLRCPRQEWRCGHLKLTAKLHGGCPQTRGPGSPSRDPALRPRTNLTRSVMQEPTTTTAAAATSSCHGLPGSPDAAITTSLDPDAALCPLPDPATRDVAPSSLTPRPSPSPARVAHPNARETARASGGSRLFRTHVPAPPHSTGLGRHGESRRRSPDPRPEPRGSFRRYPAAFLSFRLGSARARARPPGSGGGGTSGGARTHPARGSRAGRCVGRGRARVTCTPSSRRLLIGLSSRYLDPGWCGEVGSQSHRWRREPCLSMARALASSSREGPRPKDALLAPSTRIPSRTSPQDPGLLSLPTCLAHSRPLKKPASFALDGGNHTVWEKGLDLFRFSSEWVAILRI